MLDIPTLAEFLTDTLKLSASFVSALETAVYIYVASSCFHLAQILARLVVREGVQNVISPRILPFRPSAVLDVLTCAALTMSALQSDAWLPLVPWMNGAQIVLFVWSEMAYEWSALIASLWFAGIVRDGAWAIWLLFQLLLVIRPWRRNVEGLAALAVGLQACFIVLRRRDPFASSLCLALATETLIIASRSRMYSRSLGERYSMIPWYYHVFLEYVVGIRCVTADSWSTYEPETVSALPESLQGVRWSCEDRVLVGRRLHQSIDLPNNRKLLPYAHWNEVSFAPTMAGALAALAAGMRLPVTIRARVDGDQLVEEEVVVGTLILPAYGSRLLTSALSTGLCTARYNAVLVPTHLALRRVSELFLTVAFLRHL